MALTVKKIALWRKEVAHEAGALAEVLEPLAQAGANLRIVMGYALPGTPDRAAIEVFPITGKRATGAATAALLSASQIPCLLVEGDDRPGLGAEMARAIAQESVNVAFLVAETIGRRFSAVFGFRSDADAATAAKAIKSVARMKPAAKAGKPRGTRRRR
jgi:hypothetical protein